MAAVTPPATHPIHRRYYAEDLVRLRRAGESRRYLGSQRRGKIDPNPHQIDAVMFALRRIPEGGCILADEVGLGKTIEAGLVIAQLLAEGAQRILIVVPRPLLGQWQHELYSLFKIDAREASSNDVEVSEPGVFLVGREYAGGDTGFNRLSDSPPFDLCIIDEAHEVFAGIHRRFDRFGGYDEASGYARTAHRVRQIIGPSPVLLLTATPIQNSLAELWGLIQYVEPTGTLFGTKPTFVDLFCGDGDDRQVASEQAEELRRRVGMVVQRTLRRQAQEFLDKPFVGRRAQLFEYSMSPQEHSLYDDVTEYLLRPNLCAFAGTARQLLLLGFHRRMASSTAALAQSLEKVAERLRKMLRGDSVESLGGSVAELLGDLDEDDFRTAEGAGLHGAIDRAVDGVVDVVVDGVAVAPATDAPEPPTAEAIRDELAIVEDFVARARALPNDSKAESLVRAVQLAMEREDGRKKVVIFTESLVTQDYLRDLLIEHAELSLGDITLFRGTNESPRAAEAVARWNDEVLPDIAPHVRPSPTVAVRLALVHEFATRSKVLIATEAGAKGLNLQFCDTVINYDLPWNPQRIEQRIGRCHRYGQTHDVTVINFLAKDNEAQRLTFEILSTKLDLFGQVLDMSDVVLQTPRSDSSEELATALGPEFETQLRRIWDRARSVQEVEEELRRLRDSIEDRRRDLEDMRQRTIGLIESRLDDSVREVFREIHESLPGTLAEFDGELERVLTAYLDAAGIPFGLDESVAGRLLEIPPSPNLPDDLAGGLSIAIGSAPTGDEIDSIHGSHPLIEAALDEARRSGDGSFRVRFQLPGGVSDVLESRRGSRGRLALTRIAYRGFEREDRLRVTAVFEDAQVLQPAAAAHELLLLPCADIDAFDSPLVITSADLDEVVDEELFLDKSAVARREQDNFEQTMDQLDQFMEDRILIVRRGREAMLQRLREAEQTRDRALGPDARGGPKTTCAAPRGSSRNSMPSSMP